ncbi:hypothetical protein T439DRAFT_358961 [Meredithblackwellia eburnea MCA 4105]
MSPHPPTGQLYTRRKAELEDLASELGINVPEGALKVDLEDLIRDHLRSNKTVRESPNYVGLWTSIQRSIRAGSVSDDDDDADESPVEEGPSSSTTLESLVKSPVKLGKHLVSPTVNAVSEASHVTRGALRRSLSGTTSLVSPGKGVVALRGAGKKTGLSLAQAVKKAKFGTVKVVGTTQDWAGEDWVISTAAVFVEIAYLAWEAVPWQHQNFGPHKWLTRSPTPSFSLPIPSLSILLHTSFLTPLFTWSLLTILLPLLLSLIFAFPLEPNVPSNTNKRNNSNKSTTRMEPPNPVVFNIARVASAVLVHHVFKADVDKSKWTFESVKGYPQVQLLGAGLAAALTLYAEICR